MLQELLFERHAPGKRQELLDTVKDRPCWYTEIGPLNQIVSLQNSKEGSLTPVFPFRNSSFPLYELRIYDVKPGKMTEWLQAFTTVQHIRDKAGFRCGIWTNASQYIHLWGYQSFEERQALRRDLFADPAWNTFHHAHVSLIAKMENMLLIPVV